MWLWVILQHFIGMGHVTVSCIKHGKKDAKVTLLRTKKLKKLPVRASLYPYH